MLVKTNAPDLAQLLEICLSVAGGAVAGGAVAAVVVVIAVVRHAVAEVVVSFADTTMKSWHVVYKYF